MRGHRVSKGVRRRVKQERRVKKDAKRERKKRDKLVTSKYGADGHSACGRKKRYGTEWDALDHAERCMVFGVDRLRAYRCPYCDGWHLTSKPKR